MTVANFWQFLATIDENINPSALMHKEYTSTSAVQLYATVSLPDQGWIKAEVTQERLQSESRSKARKNVPISHFGLYVLTLS